jgi:hypothetical protein
VPVVAVGDDYRVAMTTGSIDDMLNLEASGDTDFLVPVPQLVDRSIVFLESVIRACEQLPRGCLEDVIPVMADAGPILLPSGEPIRLADGKPYIPHRTNIGLVRHTVGHAYKFVNFVASNEREFLTDMAAFVMLGEPDESHEIEGLTSGLSYLVQEIQRIRSHLEDYSGLTYEAMEPFWGPQTGHQVLSILTRMIAQHARQVESQLGSLGIAIPEPLRPQLFEGLGLPDGVWD